jgi:hypothetical protein
MKKKQTFVLKEFIQNLKRKIEWNVSERVKGKFEGIWWVYEIYEGLWEWEACININEPE